MYDKALSTVAVRVCNKDCLPLESIPETQRQLNRAGVQPSDNFIGRVLVVAIQQAAGLNDRNTVGCPPFSWSVGQWI
jgi:hypothetical protein